ncbi:hypothetical protein ACL7TT_14480 [Microbulbifer sp. 2304DJ12-6]|uniref:hypothetical protein n=1 Tax=Microbulbifer sp. 2304DJ12-6 TaxID=3233340 RepID=UPI0039B07476
MSDPTLVQLSPERHQNLDRIEDLTAHHGEHHGSIDIDRRLPVAAVMPGSGLNVSLGIA